MKGLKISLNPSDLPWTVIGQLQSGTNEVITWGFNWLFKGGVMNACDMKTLIG